MKLRGGYNVSLAGRPSREVQILPEPRVLYLPLWSQRFTFSDVCVKDGDQVQPGQPLARDPGQFNVPLLAPRAGKVRLGELEGHIVLEDVRYTSEEPYHPDEGALHVPTALGSAGMKRHKLLTLGAWQFFEDAHSGRLPDPLGTPQAVIVCAVRLDWFVARGDVQIGKRLLAFTRGLEHLQSLLGYQPMYLVTPEARSPLADEVREHVRGHAWVQVVTIPRRYPFDHFALLARSLGLKPDAEAPVWSLRAEGVLAVDRALTLSHPSTVRIVSLGGPAVENPRHVKVMPGYPLDAILGFGEKASGKRVIVGGVMAGETLRSDQQGLDAECTGLTVLPEPQGRQLLGWIRPGFDRQSYSRTFLSSLRRRFPEQLTTALQGERRACIACGQCEEVCPARIMPHMIHKHLYREQIEEAEELGVDLCIGCGLCSYVCPSKIELGQQFLEAQETLRQERQHAEEALR